ncbi:NifU family protein [Alphaproteobacteria bacterium]|nr:NifU family protein [Alphaproteobacteria bacterium]
MFIQTEKTPNPLALKFIPGPHLLDEPMDFPNKETAKISPLALRMFQIDDVESVFIGTSFITITKSEKSDWDVLKPSILGFITEHLGAQKPILQSLPENSKTSSSDDTGIVKDIKDILETRVRPAVAKDGGDIIFDRFEDGVVYLRLQGACSGCPSSSVTLKSGIENMLRYYVPEVNEVRAV